MEKSNIQNLLKSLEVITFEELPTKLQQLAKSIDNREQALSDQAVDDEFHLSSEQLIKLFSK